jgi:X-Pro dipeptidyl-peptidase C-terminal non-catalytic domain
MATPDQRGVACGLTGDKTCLCGWRLIRQWCSAEEAARRVGSVPKRRIGGFARAGRMAAFSLSPPSTSDPQASDLEVIGPVRVHLHVQASVPYIDLYARLCDVSPRGRSINISDGIIRLTDAARDMPHPVEFDLCPSHTPSGAGTGSGCRSPVVPTRATGARPRHRRTVRHQHTPPGQRPHIAPRYPAPVRTMATRARLTAIGRHAARSTP